MIGVYFKIQYVLHISMHVESKDFSSRSTDPVHQTLRIHTRIDWLGMNLLDSNQMITLHPQRLFSWIRHLERCLVASRHHHQ